MDKLTLKAKFAEVFLEQIPFSIRTDLLKDRTFLSEFGLEDLTVLSFKELKVSFKRKNLFDAVRTVKLDSELLEIADITGGIWQLKYELVSDGSGEIRIEVSKDEQSFILPDLSILSPLKETRLKLSLIHI